MHNRTLDTVKSLLDAQALINAHPPIWMLKMAIFLDNSRKITASIKRPLEKKRPYLMLKVSKFVAWSPNAKIFFSCGPN